MKTLLKRLRLASALQAAVITALAPGLLLFPTSGWSNPTGGVVAHGAAEINADIAGHLKVLQQSNRAVINWESFSISAGEITEFVQPSASAIALSRVIGGNPSAIYGTLKANGGHILVNQNGILVGPGGVVDVGGMNVLSTLDIDDNNFMAGGDMVFSGSTAAGVTNFGTISSAGGDVILMGNFVENHGSIGAVNGTVALGAGGEILLHQSGDAKISILRGGVGGNTGVTNTGTITGAAAELKAHGNVYALAVNNSGTIRATGVNRANGRVILSATGDGTASGKIVNTGVIEANNADGSGGEILIDAGPAGEAEIGGTVKADGVGNQPGGTVTVLGNTVNVTQGALVSASGGRGGTVTIGSAGSSTVNVASGATVQASGSTGAAGVVTVAGQTVGIGGTLDAASALAGGGRVQVSGVDVSTTAETIIDATGFTRGGTVNIRGTEEATVGGQIRANGANTQGGRVILTAPNTVILEGSTLEAEGRTRGGSINVGGGFQGKSASIPNATNTTVGAGATLSASSSDGNAGQVVVWADGETYFGGSALAEAGGLGNGGLIEISGKDTLNMRGSVDASSAAGRSGTVLFDPGHLTIGNFAGNIFNSTINDALQGGTSVIIATQADGNGDGDVTFLDSTGLANLRHGAIQWTNSTADFGVFAAGDIYVLNPIRTSGAGSINLMAGWTGLESDLAPGGLFDPGYAASDGTPDAGDGVPDLDFEAGDGPIFSMNTFGLDPEAIWEYYLERGQFGNAGNGVWVGAQGITRGIEVGSRFGNTNVAGAFLNVAASRVSNALNAYAQLGFRDTGQIFSPRNGNTPIDFISNGTPDTRGDLDLNNNTLTADNDVLVGIYDPRFFRNINDDGIVDGVYAINSAGVLDENNTATGASAPGAGDGNPTFIPFANHYTNPTQGNWWWQQIDARNPDPLLYGGILPEHGAGIDATRRADINVAVTGGVTVEGGGRTGNYAQIGHGGNAALGTDNRSARSTTVLNGQTPTIISYNGASNDRNANSIGRLGPIYGNINVLAGVDRTTVRYDPSDPKVNLTGTITGGGGVRVAGYLPTGSPDGGGNPETGNNSESYAMIGHLGGGQFGSVVGDITVLAGGSVDVLAGSHTRNFAAIGHQLGGFSYWNPTSNESAQIRFFANVDDFDNPNLRKGELFADPDGNDARGYYPADFRPLTPAITIEDGRWDDDFWDVDGDIQNLDPGDTDTGGPAQVGRDGLHPDGVVHVEAFSGAVAKTLSGDIRVESYGPGGVRVVGFSNPDTRTFKDRNGDGFDNAADVIADLNNDGVVDANDRDGLQFARDSRNAQIGHGGNGLNFSNSADEGAGEVTNLRVNPGDGTGATTASEQVHMLISNPAGTTGPTGSAVGRRLSYVDLMGDITVIAHRGGVEVNAGNDRFDYAAIGHGGAQLSDMETGNILAGDITVTGLTDLKILGGGVTAQYTGLTGRDFWTYAQIGHHGFENRSLYYTGDITVDFGGDITLTSGRYQGTVAKIGHQTELGYGQVGGEYVRNEEFRIGPWFQIYDPNNAATQADRTVPTPYTLVAGADVQQDVDPDKAVVTLTMGTAGGVASTYEISGLTANISVDAGGDLLVTHADPGLALTQNTASTGVTTPNQTITNVGAQIGHGGRRTGLLRNDSLAEQFNFKDKVGDITINATNITLQNGSGLNYWTNIGHMYGLLDSFNASNGDINRAGVLAGDITLTATQNIDVDASFAPANDPINFVFNQQSGNPARYNFVRVGHGAMLDTNDVAVVSEGTVVHGLDASSNITVTAGNDMSVKGGDAPLGSYAQVGHGYNSSNAAHFSRPAGYNGDITVTVGNNLDLTAGSLAYVSQDSLSVADIEQVRAAGAIIGHGGDMLEGNVTGDVTVNVGNDLTMTAAQRTQVAQGNVSGSPAASIYGIAKIGHWSTSYQALSATFQGVASNQEGDISVTVGNDMIMQGGTTNDTAASAGGALDGGVSFGFYRSPTIMGYTQVGHSGPGVSGRKEGNIDIRVGNDLTTVDGTVDPPAAPPDVLGVPNFNNYVMIGNGDWLRDGATYALPATGGAGIRSGDISVAVGNNATLDHTLVGHADPDLLSSLSTIIAGDTFLGVSRNNPFYGGPGILTAMNGSVFTSGLYGTGEDQVRFYIPQRENNLIATSTRINSDDTFYTGVGGTGGASFTDGTRATFGRTWDPTRGGGVDAGDTDEIYLQPDLWWNRDGVATSVGTAEDFSTGSVATVGSPGGFPNLVALAAGDLGDGTTEFRGTSDARYTVYYDAIEAVDPLTPGGGGIDDGGGGGGFIPVPEVPEPEVVPLPFDFLPFIWWDKYDSFDRDDKSLLGAGDYYLLGIGLVSRFLNDEDGDPSVGRYYESETIESLAEILGFPVDETDEKEEDDLRERNASAYRQFGGLYGIYWQYRPFGGAGRYSSYTLFGTPGL